MTKNHVLKLGIQIISSVGSNSMSQNFSNDTHINDYHNASYLDRVFSFNNNVLLFYVFLRLVTHS